MFDNVLNAHSLCIIEEVTNYLNVTTCSILSYVTVNQQCLGLDKFNHVHKHSIKL